MEPEATEQRNRTYKVDKKIREPVAQIMALLDPLTASERIRVLYTAAILFW